MPDAPMPRPSIAIIGAGAIGSLLAGLLARAGADVTLVARGARLEALRRDGLRFRDLGGAFTLTVPGALKVTDRLQSPVSVLFLCVKAPALEAALSDNLAGMGPDSRVVPLVNGIPWWFFDDLGHPIHAVDPGGRLFEMVPFDQIVGSVTMMTAGFEADGTVVSTIPHKLALGPTTPNGPRPVDLADVLTAAGIDLDRADHIRPLVWEKLAINLSTNTLSALCGHTLEEIAADPALCARAVAVAAETEHLARAWGCQIAVAAGLPAAMTRAGAFRTSMLQDRLAGRPLELAPIALAPLELAEARAIAMPETTRLLAELQAELVAGLAPPGTPPVQGAQR
ncbi:2-dehydropantoate 2-reductase [Pseudooceanicola sp. CBS1P-1]|uniref:2-dehydropantoate 2-reductase n=1 Tax=Pseudooceanicola albus TaxID=2692189 RepID=A0A6L7G9Z9_9RHOB|nr:MULTISPECIES: 2-dehydropantoate 2-reductase [Pseudooceanicola]MBT9386489.1 2-dehydropantoate 2-reductase [Pseudooceanicola endophyticus]MXN20522.1 2-dehydropantoate 2-reductase [Pseudooceanicola albus]